MAAAPAYRYDYEYAPAQPRPRQPQVYPVPSRGRIEQLDPRWFVVVRVIAVVALILSVAACIRVGLDSAAVSTSTEYTQIEADINTARAAGSALEVQAANLSNPSYVKDYAKQRLGMSAPVTIETMSLASDVVAVDENGALSLSQSLAAVARG